MKGLSAGLTFFSLSTVCAVLLGLAFGGLGPTSAFISILLGLAAAVLAFFATCDSAASGSQPAQSSWRYRSIPFWFVAGCFTIFAVRSFCWLLYIEGPEFRIQSVNNLGDLALHVTYIKTFENGIPLWPDNPIYVFSHLRYPAGVDLFNSLLALLHVELIRGLVWVGLLASVATFYAFYRWGGVFAVAGFLFNGGIIGFQFLQNLEFRDYQGANIAWKSIPLAMFVTQRGLLDAIPAGLLLLWHWREKFLGDVAAGGGHAGPRTPSLGDLSPAPLASDSQPRRRRLQGPLPFWVELALYCSLPLFHVHTFLALTVVLVCFFAFGDRAMRVHITTLVSAAFVPATFLVWLITDHFGASSMLKWQPGWVQEIGDFAHPLGTQSGEVATGGLHRLRNLFDFWAVNFGFLIPLILGYVATLGARAWRHRTTERRPFTIPVEIVPLTLTIILLALAAPFLTSWWYLLLIPAIAIPPTVVAYVNARNQRLPIDIGLAFTIPAVTIFLLGYLFKTAPWEWDNLKLMFWGYFLLLPFLWKDFIAHWAVPIRGAVCVALFGSGFVSLFGGLATPGFGFANRAELAGVAVAVRKLPVEARFAAYPTYNHPVLLQGRKVVLGYPGHLWTQGFDYHEEESKLTRVMQGAPDWLRAARALQVRYIFWGREEQMNYPTSKRPWEQSLAKIASGPWGSIYDLNQPLTAH